MPRLAARPQRLTKSSRPTRSSPILSDHNPALVGEAVVLTATVSPVSPGTGTPTGTVTFKAGPHRSGQVPLSLGPRLLSPGSEVFLRSPWVAPITAVYNGSAFFNATGAAPGSTATTVNQVVKADTGSIIVSDHNPALVGEAVVLTATVSPVSPGTGTPTGTVTFKDGAARSGRVPLSLGPRLLSPGSEVFLRSPWVRALDHSRL